MFEMFEPFELSELIELLEPQRYQISEWSRDATESNVQQLESSLGLTVPIYTVA